VTTLETDSRAVVRFHNKQGTAEQWIKEGKQAVRMTRLSCHRFRANEVRLALSVLAYNLGTSGGGSRCRDGCPRNRLPVRPCQVGGTQEDTNASSRGLPGRVRTKNEA
jgi:hypothetical protein